MSSLEDPSYQTMIAIHCYAILSSVTLPCLYFPHSTGILSVIIMTIILLVL